MEKIDLEQEAFWEFISSNQVLDEQFICNYFDSLRWDNVTEFQKLSERTLALFVRKYDNYWVWRNQELSEEFIETFAQTDDEWRYALSFQDYSDNFLIKHYKKIKNWVEFHPRRKKKFTVKFFDFAIEHDLGLDWSYFISFKKVDAKSLKKYKDIFEHMNICFDLYNEKDIQKLLDYGYRLRDIYSDKPLSEKFMRENIDNLDWHRVLLDNVNIDFIREFKDNINWISYSKYSKIPFEVLKEFKDRFNWYEISSHYDNINKDFINLFEDKINLHNVIINNTTKLDEDWVDKIYYELDKDEKYHLYNHHIVSEQFIVKHLKKERDWKRYASQVKGLSEDFIRKNANKLDWNLISQNQKLSMNFIREMQDYVNWLEISINQKLNESFIKEYKDKVSWPEILLNQNLSMKFINDLSKQFIDKE